MNRYSFLKRKEAIKTINKAAYVSLRLVRENGLKATIINKLKIG